MTTKQALLTAAVTHLDAHGLDGLTLRQIARAAGVSHGAPLRHFAGLSALLSAVAAASFDTMTDRIDARIEAFPDDPLGQLAQAGQAYVDHAIANPGAYELMFRPERLDRTDTDYLRASTRSADQLATLTAHAQAAGWRSDIPHAALTGVLWAGVHGIASLQIQGAFPPVAPTDPAGLLDVFQISLAGLPDTNDRNNS